MVRTSTATAVVRDDGIVSITIDKGVKQLLPQAQQNLAAVLSLAEGLKTKLIIDMSGALPLDPDVRHFYADAPLSTKFTAVALVVAASPLGRMMGNVYMRVARSPIPMQLFPDVESAAAWLHAKDGHG